MKLHPSILRLILGSTLSISLLLFVGGYSYHYFSKSNDSENWVTHTQEILNLIEAIQGQASTIETNQRGYLITSDKTFIKEMKTSESKIEANIAKLTQLAKDNESQSINIRILSMLIKSRIRSLNSTISLFSTDPKKALQFVKSGSGRRQTNEINTHLDRMSEIEKSLLATRLFEADEQSAKTGKLIISFIFLTLLCLVGFVYLNIRDLKRRLKTEESLRRAEKEAKSASKAKSDFLANMSHEIRTPMNAIIGMADLLNETQLDDDQKRYVQIFQRSGHALLNLINDILDLSKVEAGQLDLDQADFSITELIDQISDLVAIKAHQKGIEFIIKIDPNVPDSFIGDANRIRQVLINIVNNAIKFTLTGEVLLSVYFSTEKRSLIFSIKDTGIGMTEEQTNKVFDRFTQANEKISAQFGGTGLGLSISKKLIELMDGKISINSEIQIGTEVIIEIKLPISENQPIESKYNIQLDLKNKKVLIVDDNQHNRIILSEFLIKHEAIFDEAKNGTEALQKVEAASKAKNYYDLILLDGRMPDIDGFTVAKKMNEQALIHQTVIMMLTSDQRSGDIKKSKDLGIKDYLVKPISSKELSKKISIAIGASSKEDKKSGDFVTYHTKKEVLVADDNPDNRALIEAYLKGTNFIPTLVENGALAAEIFKNKKFDIVLMDIQMPVMDGIKATEHIRQFEKQNQLHRTPILALSAYALKEEKDKSIAAGCDAHLTKPIKKVDLLSHMMKFLQIENDFKDLVAKIDPEIKDLSINYLNQRKAEIAILKDFLKNKDFKNLNIIGHRMRGVAESYGFPELTLHGEVLEQAAKSEDITTINQAITDIEYYLTHVKIES